MTDEQLDTALHLLRQTVVYPWESVDQVVAAHGQRDLGDPSTPGTGAWHLRHIVEIFRLHARTTMLGMGAPAHIVDGLVPEPTSAIPSKPRMARDALLADIDAFSQFARASSPDDRLRRFDYGSSTDLAEMLVCMTLHITFHAAAVHYWSRWKAPASSH